MHRQRLLVSASLVLSLSLIAAAQDREEQAYSRIHQAGPPVRHIEVPPPPIDPNAYKISSELDLVLLDVSVKNQDGGFATGLEREHFQIWEDKKPQKIKIFADADIPVTVGLVVDNSGSVRPKRPEIVTAALTFVQASHKDDEIFVVNFNDRVKFGLPGNVPFTDDRTLLRQGLLANRPQGRTALYDGLKTALEHLKKGRRDKKTLVLISDGGDNASVTTKSEIMRLAEQSKATIYTVGIFSAHDKDKNPGFLKDLAKLSGGEAFMPGELSGLVGVCEKIAADIRNRYTLGYIPEDLAFDGKIRKLKVEARDAERGKLKVRTRTHYVPHPRAQSPMPENAANRP